MPTTTPSSPSVTVLDEQSSASRLRPARPCRVLVVDDDETVLRTFNLLLRQAGYEVTLAATAAAALDTARQGFDVMVLDVHLGHDNGLELLRTLRSEGHRERVVVLTGFDVDGIEAEARRLGAAFVDRWTMPDPVELVRRMCDGEARAIAQHTEPRPVVTPPILMRWAEAVATGVQCPYDPKSIALWGHAIGKSDTSLRELCDLAGVSAKNSCALVRVLRAVHLSHRSGRMDVTEWLDVADARTLKRLLVNGGLQIGTSVGVEEVLQRQRLVSNHAAIALLSRALRKEGLL